MIKPNQDKAYVVSLRNNGDSITELETNDTYMMPVGNRYLKYPPEYLAIHYHGELKRVSHVDQVGYEVNEDRSVTAVFRLGPNLLKRKVKSGRQWNRRTWVDLDYVLTEEKLIDAVEKTKARGL